MHIEDNITQEYRAQEPKDLDHGTIHKPKPKPASATARKWKPAFNPDEMMDVFMNRCIDYMNWQMRQIPDQVAEKLLEKLNKEGVMYKPAVDVQSCKNDGDDEVDSFENGLCEKKEFMYKEDNHSEDSLEPIIDLTHTWEAVPKEKNEAEEVIDSYEAHLALRVGHDCHLCPAWRSRYLVDQAVTRDNPLSSPYNMGSELSRSRAVNRVKDEYTLRDKTYVVLNVGNTHYITVVMHMRKKEFQVMDSLYPLEQSVDTVKALRLAIANDFLEANHITPGKYADVSKWPIKEYPIPQQEDC
ncbi:Pm3-like protein [Hordeum vulgare]|nr:Pm3-like protein [Hordeum vulgare]